MRTLKYKLFHPGTDDGEVKQSHTEKSGLGYHDFENLFKEVVVVALVALPGKAPTTSKSTRIVNDFESNTAYSV